MHNMYTLVNTLTYRFTNGYFYTIIDPSMCYDELVIQLNEMFNKGYEKNIALTIHGNR